MCTALYYRDDKPMSRKKHVGTYGLIFSDNNAISTIVPILN